MYEPQSSSPLSDFFRNFGFFKSKSKPNRNNLVGSIRFRMVICFGRFHKNTIRFLVFSVRFDLEPNRPNAQPYLHLLPSISIHYFFFIYFSGCFIIQFVSLVTTIQNTNIQLNILNFNIRNFTISQSLYPFNNIYKISKF